jgi:hypothetical protein
MEPLEIWLPIHLKGDSLHTRYLSAGWRVRFFTRKGDAYVSVKD